MNLLKSIRSTNPLAKWTAQARRTYSIAMSQPYPPQDEQLESPLPEWKIKVKGQSGSILQMGLGVGTYHGEEAAKSVVTGLQNGFRLIDNALMQGNQEAVGVGLKRSGLARDQF